MINQSNHAKLAFNSVMFLQIILSFVIGSSLSALWTTLNGITVIAYITMINLTFPSNYNIMNNILVKLATFDLVPEIDYINDRFFTT